MIPALLPNYARADLAFERGEGAWLWTGDGRRLLDFGIALGFAINPTTVGGFPDRSAEADGDEAHG